MHVICVDYMEANGIAESWDESDGAVFLEFKCQTDDCMSIVLRTAQEIQKVPRRVQCSVCAARV